MDSSAKRQAAKPGTTLTEEIESLGEEIYIAIAIDEGGIARTFFLNAPNDFLAGEIAKSAAADLGISSEVTVYQAYPPTIIKTCFTSL